MAAVSSIPGFGNASLYVGDLEINVNEEHIFDLFNQVAQVISVRVCRDQNTRQSLGYGYINFSSPQEANNAMEVLNFTPLNGKPIRLMLSHRDPSLRKSGLANVFIKNLDLSIDNKALYETFATFGTILSCKVAMTITGQSKGYGFVQFDQEDAAANAIKRLNGMLLNDKQVYVGLFIRRQDRYRGDGYPKYTNVYVKNLADNVSDQDLVNLFGPFGVVTSAVVMKDVNGNSKCFGFVNFQNPDSAAAAVENLNGSRHDDKVWYVGRAQKKSEREAELRAKFQQDRLSRFEKLQGCNLYMKNLDDEINDEKLQEMFSEFGTITSCKVMMDSKGASKGSGFVAFSTPEEAARALTEMNGKMVGRKPLYIAVAQRKEERKAKLQAHFIQLRAQSGMSPLSPAMPGFHPGTPRMPSQQLYYGQGNPAMMPPQPTGYGFQQQMMPPGIRPNYMMPYLPRQQQPQNGPRMGMRPRGGANGQKLQQQQQQQQMGNRHPNQGSAIPASPTVSSVLMSALRSASLEQQRIILGEHLYPLVEKMERENAGKVTGMLLEMDQPEVLHLIESPDALKKKVAEALDVLRRASRGDSAEADVSNGVVSSTPPEN